MEGRGAEAEDAVVWGVERGAEIQAYSSSGTQTNTHLNRHLAGREPCSCRELSGKSERRT